MGEAVGEGEVGTGAAVGAVVGSTICRVRARAFAALSARELQKGCPHGEEGRQRRQTSAPRAHLFLGALAVFV